MRKTFAGGGRAVASPWPSLAGRRVWPALLAFAAAVCAGPAAALGFTLPIFGETIDGSSNTTLIGGLAVRTEPQQTSVIGKNQLNPNVCGRTAQGQLWYQDCQGLFTAQSFPAAHLASAPGAFSDNFSAGDLNYKQGDITQALLRVNQDVTLTWGNFTFFAKGIAFYDPLNDNFTEYHPNEITRQNYQQVGYLSTPGTEILRGTGGLSILSPIISRLPLPPNIVTQLLSNPTAIPTIGVRNDSTPCPANRNPSGQPCGIVYGPGGVVHSRRASAQTLHEIGAGIMLLDANLSGKVELSADQELLFRVGRQQVNWGEATLEFFDSLNIANPPNLNNFFRIGGNGLDDFYQPLNMVSLAISPLEHTTISAFYQLEWQPIETPAEGSFYSPVNLGTKNDGPQYLTVGFGNTTPDPDGVGRLLDNPLSGITNTTSRMTRLSDKSPSPWNTFGVQFKYLAEWLNNGTDLGLYFANYAARSPFISIFSTEQSCAKNARNTVEFLLDCPNIPLLQGVASPNTPAAATSNALALDGLKYQIQYPQAIQMIGASFNTSFGTVSVQGEAAFRPRDPLQVDVVDLVFAGLGPSLTNCHLAPGCSGSTLGLGPQANGDIGLYGNSNYTVKGGAPGAYPDTFDLIVGQLPGSGRSFPNFIIPYRGGTLGRNPPNSLIRGWEYFKTLSLDMGATYVEGNTDFTPSLVGADQIIWLFEAGARGILDLPPLDKLALAVPGTYTSPTAGADGSGANGSRQACSSNQACVYGPDGLRFNPHQAPLGLYPTQWSGGYGAVILVRYESVLPGISLQPQIIFKHDVFGHSPGYLSNYVRGRILWDTNLELRYKNSLSFNVGYQMWAGGGDANLFRDRDTAKMFVKYSF